MRRVGGCLGVSIGLLVLTICWLLFVADARTEKVILDPEGKTSKGSVFGVTVGDSAQQSIVALRKAGFTDLVVSDRPAWFTQHPDSDKFIYGYDLGWRHGVVCVMLQQNRVQAVAWSYNMLNP